MGNMKDLEKLAKENKVCCYALTAGVFVLYALILIGAVIGQSRDLRIEARLDALEQQPELVERVVDGDTVVLEGGERVRVENIDAPEKDEPGHAESTAALRELCEGKKVTVRRSGRDRYGRTLARLEVDGRDLGEVLVRRGLARRWEE